MYYYADEGPGGPDLHFRPVVYCHQIFYKGFISTGGGQSWGEKGWADVGREGVGRVGEEEIRYVEQKHGRECSLDCREMVRRQTYVTQGNRKRKGGKLLIEVKLKT